MTPPIISASLDAFPIVTIRYVGAFDDVALQANQQIYKRLFARNERFAVVFDAREGVRPSAAMMKKSGAMQKEITDDMHRLCAGLTYVIHGTLARMTIRSIFFTVPKPCPIGVHSSIEDARQWCEEQLQAAL